MRRTRAVLAMLLAAGMAAHALATRPAAPPPAPPDVALIAPVEATQLASVDRHEEEQDEVMAVDADLELIPVQIELP